MAACVFGMRSPVSVDMVSEWWGHDKNTLDLFIPQSSDIVWSASSDGMICKWSLPNAEKLAEYRVPVEGELEYQAIAPENGELAFAIFRDGSHLVWDIESEQVITRLSGPTPKPYRGPPRFACAFSPEESCLAAMSGELGVTIYDLKTGETLNEVPGQGVPLRCMQFSPDGLALQTLSEDGLANIWSCVPDDRSDRFKAHEDVIYQMDIDAAGATLLTGAYTGAASTWNLLTNQQQASYQSHQAEIVAVDLHPVGNYAASLDANGEVHVWNIFTAEQLFQIDPDSDEFANHLRASGGGLRSNVLNFPAVMSTGIFTPDGTRLVAFQHEAMKSFDAHSGRVASVLKGSTSSGWPVYSYDSDLVAVLEMNARDVGVWDLETG